MGQIIYEILTGTPNFTASITPAVQPDQTHVAVGVYSFDDLPDDYYTLYIIDSEGCSSTSYVTVGTPTTTTTSTSTSSTTTTTTTAYVSTTTTTTTEIPFLRAYYFANNGNDSNDGSIAHPFKTLTKANSLVLSPGDALLFKRGDTFTGKLTIQNSGTLANNIVVSSYGAGDKAVISPLSTLTGWTNMGGGIYAVGVSVESSPNLLLIDGIQYAMGRYPSTGQFTIDSHVGYTQLTSAELHASPNWTGAEVVFCKNNWSVGRFSITSHVDHTLTFINSFTYGPTDGWGFYVQNSLSTLDQFGEWYYNPNNLTLYVYFGGVDPLSVHVEVPIYNHGIELISGRSRVTFYDIAVKGSNTRGISLINNPYITVNACDVSYSGQGGIRIAGSADAVVVNNTVNMVNDYGILTTNISPRSIIRYNTVTNVCTILCQGISLSMISGTGIYNNMERDVIIEENIIDTVAYCGIIFTGDNIIVRNNYITNSMMLLQDGGGIYGSMNPTYSTPATIEGNVIINNGSDTPLKPVGYSIYNRQGIYIDQGNSNPVYINENTCANLNGHGLFIHNSKYVELTNNNVYNCNEGLFFQEDYNTSPNYLTITDCVVTGNTFVAVDPAQLVIWARLEVGSVFTQLGTLNSNYYMRPVDDATPIKKMIGSWDAAPVSLSAWKIATAQDANSQGAPFATSSFLFDYNVSAVNKVVTGLTNMYSVAGDPVTSYTLAPYTSITLLELPSTTTTTTTEAPFLRGYYFSEAGDDGTGDGSIGNPYKTVAKANTLSLIPGDALLFNRGDVFTGGLIIQDSGTAANPIIISAYGSGYPPEITGFTTLSTWTDIGGGIWSTPITCPAFPNMLTIDNVQYGMGRTPDTGTYYYIDSTTGGQDITSSDLDSAIVDWTGAQVVVRSVDMIKWTVGNIASHIDHTITYTLQPADFDPPYTNGVNCAFFIQNDIRTLTAYGEWYYNSSTNILYMYCGAVDPNTKTIKISTVDTLCKVEGYNYVTIDSIYFTGSNAKSIYFRLANYCVCRNSSFSFSGNWGIHGSRALDLIIEDNRFTDTNDSALLIASYSHRCIVRRNVSYNAGLVLGNGRSLYYTGKNFVIFQNDGEVIEYNQVYNSGSGGINIGGTPATVRYNYVDTFSLNKADCGGIAFGQPMYSNISITNNIVLNGMGSPDGQPYGESPHGCFGIYLDYYSNGVTVYQNTVANVMGGGIMLNGNNNNNIIDNTVYNCTLGIYIQEIIGLPAPIRDMTITGNIFLAATLTQRALLAISEHYDFDQWGVLNNNYYMRPADDNLTISTCMGSWAETHRTLAGWQSYSSQDPDSVKAPFATDQFLFDYNETQIPKTVTGLVGMYDVDGNPVTEYTLHPFNSIVLMGTTTTTTTTIIT